MSYRVREELSPDRWSITFECDPRTQAALLRDFPWLRDFRAVLRSRQFLGIEPAPPPETHPLLKRLDDAVNAMLANVNLGEIFPSPGRRGGRRGSRTV